MSPYNNKPASQMNRYMSSNNEELAHQFVDAWNDSEWDRFRELTTDDWVLHGEWRSEPIDIDQYIEKEMKEVRASLFLDTHVNIEEVFDGGDHFTILVRRTGTVGEEYAGYDVTDDGFEHPGMMTCRVKDGAVSESWGVQDHGQRYEDLGILPDK